MFLSDLLNSVTRTVTIYAVIAAAGIGSGAYLGYHLTSEHYEAIIATSKTKVLEEKNAMLADGDKRVSEYVIQLKQLEDQNKDYKKQIAKAVGPNQCAVSDGFVRLYNASESSVPSAPSSTDAAASTVDSATLLSILIDNNEKYNQVAKQLTDLQAYINDTQHIGK